MSQKMLCASTVVGLFMFLIYSPFPIGVIVYLVLGGVAGLIFGPGNYKRFREISGIMLLLGIIGGLGWGMVVLST